MTTPRRIALIGAAVFWLAIGGAALAQTTPPAPPAASPPALTVEALQAQNSAAAAVALGAQPIAADQLALGRRYLKAMNVPAGLRSTLDALFAQTRAQALHGVANQPPANQAKFTAALDETLAATKAEVLDNVLAGLARYYAARLTPGELNELLALYENPLGQKAVLTPQAMTEADRQQMGQYVMAHPSILESMGAVAGSLEVTQALVAREAGGMTTRFKTRLCDAMRRRGMSSTACVAAKG